MRFWWCAICSNDSQYLSITRTRLVGYIYDLTPKKLIQKVSQRNLVLFFMPFNILKVCLSLTIRKGSFSRWRSRWLPRAKILYTQGNIQPRNVFLVSNRRVSLQFQHTKSLLYSNH